MQFPYDPHIPHSRERAIYGVSVHKLSGLHVCFNRDYQEVLVELPAAAVSLLVGSAQHVEAEPASFS